MCSCLGLNYLFIRPLPTVYSFQISYHQPFDVSSDFYEWKAMFDPCILFRCLSEINVVVHLFTQIQRRVSSTVKVVHELEPHTYISYKVNTL